MPKKPPKAHTPLELPDSFELRWATLSKAERRVAELMAMGFSAQTVAEMTSRSVSTIEVHRYHILKKMACETAVGLTKDYWCYRTRQEMIWDNSLPMVICRQFGAAQYYYQGYFFNGRPVESVDVTQAAVFAGQDNAKTVADRLDKIVMLPGLWQVVPQKDAIQKAPGGPITLLSPSIK